MYISWLFKGFGSFITYSLFGRLICALAQNIYCLKFSEWNIFACISKLYCCPKLVGSFPNENLLRCEKNDANAYEYCIKYYDDFNLINRRNACFSFKVSSNPNKISFATVAREIHLSFILSSMLSSGVE